MRRFIPAPAGNAVRTSSVAIQMPVHPRACGERLDYLSSASVWAGSSPRLRGTLRFRYGRHGLTRFIPAPAGNAIVKVSNRGGFTVHPRACGERTSRSRMTPLGCGSSPRLRGTPRNSDPCPYPRRFIPAPAGNAGACAASYRRRAVHPRACGERLRCMSFSRCRSGSSPRLRGTLDQRQSARLANRFIPAPAGNACDVPSAIAATSVHPRACGERLPALSL